jgi:hypothetical protein
MKMIYSLAALAFLATAATAAPSDCWQSQGNWQNASTKSCSVAGGGSPKAFCETKKGNDTCACKADKS